MRKYLLLTKVLLKSSLGQQMSAMRNKRNKNRNKNKNIANNANQNNYNQNNYDMQNANNYNVNNQNKATKENSDKIKPSTLITYALLFMCFLPVIFMLYQMAYGGYMIMSAIGQEGVLLEIICHASAIITLVFGIPMVLSVFYMSSDLAALLPLPFKPYQIVGAKLTTCVVYEYITMVFIAPAFFGYGIAARAGIIYWILIVIAMILLPIVPMIYAAILSMIFMRLIKGAKNKDFISTFGTIFILIFVLGFNMIMNSTSGYSDAEMADIIMQKGNSLVGVMSNIFPNYIFLSKALVNGDFLQMLLFIVSIVAIVAIFLFIAQKIYFAAALGMSETVSKKGKLSKSDEKEMLKKNSVMKAYFDKEMRVIFRTPAYFLNCVLMTLIFPLFMIIPMMVSLLSQPNISFSDISNVIEEMKGAFSSDNSVGIILLVIFGITMFIGATNVTSGTSISREGQGYIFMKYIPVPYKTQIQAKVLCGMIISILGTTTYAVIATVILVVVFRAPFMIIPFAIIITVVVNIAINYFQIAIDLINPKLNWENEQMAVKQNTNVAIEMFAAYGIGAVIALIVVVGYILLSLPVFVVAGIGCIVFAIIDFLAYKMVIAFANKKLDALE